MPFYSHELFCGNKWNYIKIQGDLKVISVPSTPDIVCSRTTPATMSAAFICELCDKTFELKRSLAYHKHRIHGLQLLGAGSEGDALQMVQLYEEETSPMHQEVSPLLSKTPEMPILSQEVTPPLNTGIEKVKVTEKGNRLEKVLTREKATSSDETPRKSKRLSLSSSSNVQHADVTTPPKAKHAKPSRKKMPTKESKVMQEKVSTVTENMNHSKSVDTETEEEPFLDVEDELINDQASDTSETSRTRGYKKALPCEQCDQKFYLLVNLQSHVQEKHGAVVTRAKKTITDIQKAPQDPTNETPPGQEDEVFECAVCFRIFRTKAKFDEHCEKAHSSPKSSPAKSDVVQAPENVAVEAQSKTDSNTEIRAPTPDKRLMCSLCSSKFRNNIGLTMHIRNVHKKLICSDCHDIFDEQSELDDHILVHILQNQFNTDQVQNPSKTWPLGKTSSSAVAVNSEDTNLPNSSKKVIQCLYCYHSCIQPSQMINHISRTHKLNGCDECWDAFDTKDDLKEHKENFHSDTDPSDKIKTLELKLKTLSEESTNLDLKCKICNANFLFRNALFLHVSKYHKKETCHFCLFAFKPEEMETHKTSCPLKNKNCNTNDTSKTSDHKKVEQNVIPAKTPVIHDKSCFYCEQKCGSYTELWSHLHARHSTEAKFQCKICDCIFYNSKEYLAHEEWENSNPEKSKLQTKDQRIARAPIESGPKYQCPLCKKNFTTSWPHVRRHVVQVHKHLLFRCHQCSNTSFLEEESLKCHISKEHPKLRVTQPVSSFYSKQSHRNEIAVDNKVDSSVGMLKSENVKVQPNITSKDTKKIVCKYCCKMYASSDLMSHLKNIHPTEFFCSCNMCDTVFFNIDDLTQHESHVHIDKSDAGPSMTEIKVKHSSNQHTDRKGTEVGHKPQNGPSQKSSLCATSPIDSVIKVASPSKHPSTDSKTSSSSVKSSSGDASYKLTVNDEKQGSSQKISFPFKMKASSPLENKSKTSQKPKPLKCQFCDEVMFSAATLIDHLQQHAKNSF